jgi:hypothetical protein
MKKKLHFALPTIFGWLMLLSLTLAGFSTADTTWKVQTVDSQVASTSVGSYNSIALDSTGNPLISYNYENELRLAEWNGTSWNIQTVDPIGYAKYISLALDSTDQPYIGYLSDRPPTKDINDYGYPPPNPPPADTVSNAHLRIAERNGTVWNTQIIGPPQYNEIGKFTSLAINSNGNPYISYQYCISGLSIPSLSTAIPSWNNEYSVNWVKLANWNGLTWNIQPIEQNYIAAGLPRTFLGCDTSIVLDSNNNPHISYDNFWYPTGLRLAEWNGKTWNIQTVDPIGVPFSFGPIVGTYSSLALDSFGNPHISYCVNGNLKLAEWNGTAWNKQILDSGNVGGDTSLALDSNNNSHISYYMDGVLKLAEWNGTVCNIQTIDSAGNGDTSLVLDSSGNPHISYFNSSGNGALNYVSTDLTPPPTATPTLASIIAVAIVAVAILTAIFIKRKREQTTNYGHSEEKM